MKIGVITYWQSTDNYGQLLQCWALQHYLKELGHDVYLIRYDLVNRKEPKKPLWKKIIKALLVYPIYKRFKRQQLRKITQRKIKKIEEKNILRRFSDFRNKYINCSEKIYKTLEELQSCPPNADLYITGSDQVWGQLLSNKENEVFFLNFGDENVKRISYAASFGMKAYPTKLRKILVRNLSRLNNISVREEDGIKICESVGIKAIRTLDPTLLLSKQDFLEMIGKSKHNNYAYIYSLNISSPEEMYFQEIKEICIDKSLKIVVTPSSGNVIGEEIYDDVEYDYATIPEWLANIANAKFVVTTSFHGVVFCILMRTPFVYVPLRGVLSKMNNRVLDLLTTLNLTGRIVKGKGQIANILKDPIVWDKSLANLSPFKIKSEQFLHFNLKL